MTRRAAAAAWAEPEEAPADADATVPARAPARAALARVPARAAAAATPYADLVEHLPLVRRIARQIARRVPAHVAVEDLEGAGALGLVEAAGHFDPARGQSFRVFAEWRIRGAIYDELRAEDPMPKDARIAQKKLQRAIAELAARIGRAPEEEEIAAELGLTLDAYRRVCARLAGVRVIALDDLRPQPEGENADPCDAALVREVRGRLIEAIGRLPERQRIAIDLHVRRGLTLREVGETLGVGESRACQIIGEAVVRLRADVFGPEEEAHG